jgi:hypothetical protein
MGVVTMTITHTAPGPVVTVTDVLPYLQIKSLQIEHYLNNRPVLRCRLRVKEGVGYRPDARDEVVVTDDNGSGAVRIFGGIVFSVKETDVVDYKHSDFDLDCTGYEVFADSVLINGIVTGTTKDMLTTIVNNLTPHGLAVDPLMTATGPALPAQGFPWFTCRQALDQIATASNWNWKFDYFKKVRMDPGSGATGAPFQLTDTNSSISSLEHTKSLANYVNELFVLFGGQGQRQATDTWVGGGGNKIFVLNHPPAASPPTVTEQTSTSPVTYVTYPVAVVGTAGFRWLYDPALRRLEVAASEAAPINTAAISSTYTAQYPGVVFKRNTAEFNSKGPWTIVVEYPDVEKFDEAEFVAQGELDRRVGVVRRLRATTYTPGLEPGQSVEVTATKRDLVNADFLIDRVSISHETTLRNGSHLFRYEIEALEGNQYQQNWIEFFRNLQGKRVASGSASSAVSGGSSGPVTKVAYAFWGGSRQFGQLLSGWADVIDFVPIRLEAPASGGTPVTVRVIRRTANAAVNVRTRIVRSDTGVEKVLGSVTNSTTWNTEFLTFTPDEGVFDYHLQVSGSANTAQVFAIGVTV